ncbi:MAG: DUF2459 domain-containing protein [Planctomycetes bacterium]|nr:DUF2459 domain-containing protein [Planctomycetota bacterium]
MPAARKMLRYGLAGLGLLAVAIAGAASITGCLASIRPPAEPSDPVTVVLVDYGYHSSLVLSTPEGGSIEYAYGEWDWFALNKNSVFDAISTVCPSQGTLGRREHAAPPDPEPLRAHISCQEMFALAVARADAEALRQRLEARFQKAIATRIHNPETGLDHVKDDESYTCLNNCNPVVLRWLRELGCDIGGSPCFARFRVVTGTR